MIRKYTEERPIGTNRCYDCGMKYDDTGWIEIVVPDDIWETISPTHRKGGGLLCGSCLIRRLVIAGIKTVSVEIYNAHVGLIVTKLEIKE